MAGYVLINLKDMLDELGEERVKSILSNFSCSKNLDVEYFFKDKAIEFANQGIAATHLVFSSYKEQSVLIGYYTLATKYFFIHQKTLTSSRWRRRIAKFGTRMDELKGYNVSAPLIAQLAKDDTYGKLITGDELLKIACRKVAEIQRNIGGKIVYLECEDKPQLVKFYT